MTYEPERRCQICGGESPRVEVCGECEVAQRGEERIAELLKYIEKLEAASEALCAHCDKSTHRNKVTMRQLVTQVRAVLAEGDR